jgi:nitrite reductase (NADH) small subunit
MSMHDERFLCRLADIPPGEGRTFEMDGQRIAVFHTRTGSVFATAAECPHKGGPLADGMLGGTTVTCPLHERVYDLANGRELTGDCDLLTYPVRRTADGIVLLLPAASDAMIS